MLRQKIHKTIKKVTEDIERFHFNTAISAIMELVNEIYISDVKDNTDERSRSVRREAVETVVAFQGRSEEHPQFGGKGVSRYDGVDFTTFSTANGLADANWEPPVARVLAHGASPIASGLLTQWDTSRFTDGNYELRLSVRDSLALTGASQVVVMVDNAPPWAEETTPVLVSATAGGDVYTTGGNVRLYFGPHAFGRDAMVEITKLDAAQIPDTLANGAARLRPGYAIAW